MGLKIDKKQKQVLQAMIDTLVAPLDDDEALALVQCHDSNRPLHTDNDDDDEEGVVVDYSAMAALAGSDVDDVMAMTLQYLEHALPPVLRDAVLSKLYSLHQSGWFFQKRTSAFVHLPRAQRECTLQRWTTTPGSRLVFRMLSMAIVSSVVGHSPTLRSIMGVHPYRKETALKTTPVPDDNGYTRITEPYRMLTLYEAQVLQAITFDVIVVGSGAGAGVIAAQVASVGESVLIIEKGKYYSPDELDATSELDTMTKMYDGHGIQYNKTGSVGIMAGSTLGGGTSVDHSVALDPPQSMLDEWAEMSGDLFDPTLFKRDLATVKARIGVTNKGIKHNRPNKILKEGCAKLGVSTTDCPNSTRAFFPPPKSHRYSINKPQQQQQQPSGTPNTWLRDAEAYGARIMDQTEVTKIIIKDGKAVGVECLYKGGKTKFAYTSKIVVVAAGSMHTPTLLKKSGLKNKHIGRHLKVHPTTYVQGYYQEPPLQHDGGGGGGSMISAMSHVPADVNNHSSSQLLQAAVAAAAATTTSAGAGARIYVAPMPPAWSAMVFPWRGSLALKQSLAKNKYAIPLAISATDVDGYDDATMDMGMWRLTKQDEASLINGVVRACRILAVTGAKEVVSSQLDIEPFVFDVATHGGLEAVKDPAFNAWLDRIRQIGVPDGVYSMHQMGSCRMAKHPQKGVTKVTGETWEINHLYVADTSLFMTASGVDPLLTVETLAYGVARHIISRLGKPSW
ncbi:unnamed protein product [Absidia cylindrospora]